MARKSKKILNEEQEVKYLQSLELYTDEVINQDRKGRRIKWYGNRLRFLMAYYDRGNAGVGEACYTTAQNVSHWCNNHSKPTKPQLNSLSLLFEVPTAFFFEPEITIKIEHQLIAEYIKKDDKVHNKTSRLPLSIGDRTVGDTG